MVIDLFFSPFLALADFGVALVKIGQPGAVRRALSVETARDVASSNRCRRPTQPRRQAGQDGAIAANGR